ncbi:hypothetical protein BVY04_03545 [bacterium M21]|nr:hypothetical protein BVY04_03545 [bacterium M21]
MSFNASMAPGLVYQLTLWLRTFDTGSWSNTLVDSLAHDVDLVQIKHPEFGRGSQHVTKTISNDKSAVVLVTALQVPPTA